MLCFYVTIHIFYVWLFFFDKYKNTSLSLDSDSKLSLWLPLWYLHVRCVYICIAFKKIFAKVWLPIGGLIWQKFANVDSSRNKDPESMCKLWVYFFYRVWNICSRKRGQTILTHVRRDWCWSWRTWWKFPPPWSDVTHITRHFGTLPNVRWILTSSTNA